MFYDFHIGKMSINISFIIPIIDYRDFSSILMGSTRSLLYLVIYYKNIFLIWLLFIILIIFILWFLLLSFIMIGMLISFIFLLYYLECAVSVTTRLSGIQFKKGFSGRPGWLCWLSVCLLASGQVMIQGSWD